MSVPPELAPLLVEHLDTSPFGSAVIRNSDGRLVYANEAGLAELAIQCDLEPGELVGRTMQELNLVDSEAHRLELAELARQPGGHLERFDFLVSGASLLHSRVISAAGVEYTVSTRVDISVQAATQQALADTTERLQKAQALAQTGDFVSELYAPSHFNGSAEAMRILGLGEGPGTVPTEAMFASFHPDDRQLVNDAIEAQIPVGSLEVEHRLAPDEAGMVRWVFTRATVETDAAGRSTLRGTVQDITARKHADEERERLNEKVRATQKLESLGVLAGGIAHDFNNLLATIMGNADFALLDESLDEPMRDRLTAIVTASQRAADLTRQLLAYSGKGQFVVEQIDPSALIREMAELLAVTISKDHRLEFELADAMPPISGDATQLRQVIMNLIINGSEAIGEASGTIRITTRPCVCDTTYLEAAELVGQIQEGRCVIVEVADDGVGMDSDTLRRLYDPFFSTKFTGRGLGMAAVLGIVNSHGGAIRVRSEPGVGTMFTLYLPVAEGSEMAVAVEAETPANWRGDEAVLIVDDDDTIREYAAGVLEQFGYLVLQAADGQMALQQLRSSGDRLGLVLLDLTMPNMDGRLALETISAQYAKLPVVLMSGRERDEALGQLDSGALAGFLPKPFMVDALMGSVRAALDGEAASRRAGPSLLRGAPHEPD